MRTERGEAVSFAERPYLRALLQDTRPRQVWVACAQSGKTVTGLAKLLHLLAYPPDDRARTVIYTFPTKTDVDDFSKARAKPMIQTSPLLAGMVTGVDNAGLKQLANGSTIYFRGTWTERTALSIPADLLVHDELDRSHPDTLQMYQDRLRASLDPRTYLYSTPTLPGFGISAAWQSTDQREWFWTCGACGTEQVFAPMDRSVPWQEHLDLETPAFRCTRCRAAVERPWILAGRWVAQAPENAGRAGYHITGIMPPEASAVRLAEAWSDALFPELFVQGHLGLPEVSGEKSLTEDMICFGDWPNTLQHPGPLFAGVDQGKKLDFIAGDGAGRIVSVQRFDDWSQVASAMRTLHVRMLVGDAAPDARPMQQLVTDFPGRVMLADYSMLKVVGEEWFAKKPHQPFVAINRTAGLDTTRDPIVMGGDGGDVFPALPYDLQQVLKAQLCASVRTRETDAHGNPVARWVETGPDHFRHAHLYYRVASEAETTGFGEAYRDMQAEIEAQSDDTHETT
jgi:hypothetical protein